MQNNAITDSDKLAAIILVTLRNHIAAKGELEMPGAVHFIDDYLRVIQQWLGVLGQQPPPQDIATWRQKLLSQLETLSAAGQHVIVRFTFEPHEHAKGLQGKFRLKISLQHVAEPELSAHSFEHLAVAKGELSLPALPAFCVEYAELLERLLVALDRSPPAAKLQALRRRLAAELSAAFDRAAESRLLIRYQTAHPDLEPDGFILEFDQESRSLQSTYKAWLEERTEPLFGRYPDAKVMAVAAEQPDLAQTPILDIGAGTGRNSLALARAGNHVDALELMPAFAELLSKDAKAAGLPVDVIQGNILDDGLLLQPNRYRLIIASEVIPHFRDRRQLHQLLLKASKMLQANGLILFNLFLTVDGYEPDVRVLEFAQNLWSYPLTRAQLHGALDGLPYELLSDESVHDYEQSHLPPEAWPPTPWFPSWATGRNLFPIKQTPPLELRWLVCRKFGPF